MRSLTKLVRVMLIWFALIAPSLASVTLADDGPGRSAIEQARAKRRNHLRKLEEYTTQLRAEILEGSRDVVAGQAGVIKKAEADFAEGTLQREVAEYAVLEYERGIHPQDLISARSALGLAESDLERARTALDEALADDRSKDPYGLLRRRLDVERATFDKAQAETELDVLTRYKYEKNRAQLAGQVQLARGEEAIKASALKAARDQGEKLAEQSKRLAARSPEALVVALIKDSVRAEERAIALIGEAKAIEQKIRDKPEGADALMTSLREKRDQIQESMSRAEAELADAATLGEQVRLRRIQLADAETRLAEERAKVDRAEREIPVPK